MAIPPLKSLKGLPVFVVHPPDADGRTLIDHLRRIGCHTEAAWPIPKEIPARTATLFLSIDHEHRADIIRLARGMDGIPPAIIAIVDYENPSTLEILFEIGVLAAMDRPIRPFGVLTNLLLARGLWQDRLEQQKRLNKLERRLSSMQRIQKAKAILMSIHGIGEEAAYETIRQQAMSKRASMDEIATSIINANELLHFPKNSG
ncbi:ANTAR domain-containing protein [Ancylobacter sp. Lp-2]|uniref:ANTAR domain-containing response regulator n=1 Tax=Ancylobacter sp. Lp-2 TaxID=2881339 RepID=UPI001E3E295C|nr:ANTAR domain-containing protein [Ancylobacter sp. Lp-2]MCB4767743.1 ANTAR domain-containing protein [Ancylobacter sp. Lp-2]